MGLFTDHLLSGTYPYLTLEEFVDKCPAASRALITDDAVIDVVEDASLVVYYLTGRQFDGTGTTVIRPDSYCYSCGPYKIPLGVWPVTNIVAVREEGEDKDPADFHIDEYAYLVRDDGLAFPKRGNWYAEAGDSEDNETSFGGYVFEVTVEHGMEIPRLIKRATLALACSLYADCVGNNDSCSLPERVTNITRNGVSMEVGDFADILSNGDTGIYAVNLAIQVFNPSRLQSPSFVWTPDLYRGTRTYT